MPIFELSKAFDLGRGIKVFLNLQTGATRGAVPDPWHRQNSSKTLKRIDQEIHRLRKRVKKQGRKDQEIHRLNKLVRKQGRKDQEIHRLNKLVRKQRMDLFHLRNDFRVSNGEVGALPDFIVIGAMRCGTSRFYELFTRHPHVQPAATKELHFFDQLERFDRGIEWYRKCFPPPEQKDGQRTITGEATPMYLFDPLVPERMAQAVSQTRLVVLLRNPVDRAYSHYNKRVRERGQETPSFEETVEEELAWLDEGKNGLSSQERRPEVGHVSRYDQLARGIYVDQLVRWRQFFDEEQMLVLKSEDFFKHTADILKQVQTFLGLPYKEIKLPPHLTTRRSTYEYEPMDPALRQRLEVFFEPHNRRLYDYLGRDFGW